MKNFIFAALCVPPAPLPKFAIYGAGLNNYGECALNGTGGQWQYGGDSYLPYVVPVRPGNGFVDPDVWKQFHMSYQHTLAIRNDGTLWSCGSNAKGQLGHGDKVSRRTLTQVGTKNNWVKVQAATEFSCALDADGKIWTCGDNSIAAQLNDGTAAGERTTFYDTSLTPEDFHPAGIVFVDIAATHRYVIALDTNGDIWTWGNNGSRQLGRGSPGSPSGATADMTCAKVDVAGPFRKILSGDYHAGAIDQAGVVHLWGLTGEGQRSTFHPSGNSVNYPMEIPCNDPGMVWSDVYLGQYNTFLYRSDGTVWVCGRNSSGQLGLGSSDNVIELTQLPGSWKWIVSGIGHTMAIATDGTLWAAGNNNFKQLGSAALTNASYDTFQQVSTDTTWHSAYPGEYSTLVIKSA